MQEIIVLCGQYLYLLVLATAMLVLWRCESHERRRLLLVGVIAGVLAFVFTKLGGLLINDPRPFVIAHTLPLIPHGADNGFPSDHTVLCMTVAGVLALRKQWIGGMLALCALLVGAARVLAGLHHPLDILGGIAIALLAVAGGYYIASCVERFFGWGQAPPCNRS
jgi:undecaprenyl-diphosphatase